MKTKHIVMLISLLLITSLTIGATYVSKMSVQSSFILLRAEGDEDSSTIDLTSEGNFAQKPSGAIELKSVDSLSSPDMKIGIIAYAGAAADKTFTVDIFSWRASNGIAQQVCSIAYITGTQAVVVYPQGGTATSKFWADTATVTSYHSTGVSESSNDGNDRVVEIIWDEIGGRWIYAQVRNADGTTGAEAGDVAVYYFYFN